MTVTNTIFAVSSGRSPAAIAVLRVTGSGAAVAAQALSGIIPEPRRATLRALRDEQGALLDRALLLWFPGGGSVTGEDLLEIHAHGGRAVVHAIERALARLPATRQAEPGEFTRRALQNGRLDLAQAEGLADLLAAETEAQRRQALLASEGTLSAAVRAWMTRLSDIGAIVEVAIDYDDEAPVGDPLPEVRAAIAHLRRDMEGALARPPIERLRDGVRVVLAGERNVGKSSLFNALLEREAAIASPIAGTTRDVLEASIVRHGVAIALIDTAGLAADTPDPIEAMGIARAQDAIARADILLWLGDAEPPPHASIIALHPRADEREGTDVTEDRLPVSIRWPASVDRVWKAIEDRAADLLPGSEMLFNGRQRASIAAALEEMKRIEGEDLLLVAEHLRLARRALGAVLGIDATEALLDSLFGRFCLGK